MYICFLIVFYIKYCYNLRMSTIFAERLKQLRMDNQMSQSRLAKILNVSQVSIFKWEQKQIEPNFDMMLKICDFFNVSPSYMLGREDSTVSTTNSHNSNSSNNTVSIGGSVSGNVAIGNNVFVGDKKDTKKR